MDVRAQFIDDAVKHCQLLTKFALQCEESAARKYLATVLRIIEEEVCAGNKVSFQRCVISTGSQRVATDGDGKRLLHCLLRLWMAYLLSTLLQLWQLPAQA